MNIYHNLQINILRKWVSCKSSWTLFNIYEDTDTDRFCNIKDDLKHTLLKSSQTKEQSLPFMDILYKEIS